MAHVVIGATHHHYAAIAGLIGRAFGRDELELWHYLVANDPAMRPGHVRVAVAGEQVLACTVALPRRIRTRRGLVDAAVITLVACDPDHRNQGLGGATVTDALRYCRVQGWAFGLLYGHPGYYPRFGYAAVLPRTETELAADSTALMAPPALRSVTAADLNAVAKLYEATAGAYPLAVARSGEPWVWQWRQADGRRLLVWEDRGQLRGYARLESESATGAVIVPEGAVIAPLDAVPLLAGINREAAAAGAANVRLLMPGDHLLVRAARCLGASQKLVPARAGMAAIVDWPAVLPADFAVDGERLDWRGRTVLTADRDTLTRLALGYWSGDDLDLLPDVRWLGGVAGREAVRSAFGSVHPRWTLAPYW